MLPVLPLLLASAAGLARPRVAARRCPARRAAADDGRRRAAADDELWSEGSNFDVDVAGLDVDTLDRYKKRCVALASRDASLCVEATGEAAALVAYGAGVGVSPVGKSRRTSLAGTARASGGSRRRRSRPPRRSPRRCRATRDSWPKRRGDCRATRARSVAARDTDLCRGAAATETPPPTRPLATSEYPRGTPRRGRDPPSTAAAPPPAAPREGTPRR